MDVKLADDIRRRMEYERGRKEAPADFPVMPDLPLARFLDRDFYNAEIELMWKKSWLFVGNVSEFSEPGSYQRLKLPFAPVIVAKGMDGEIRAFLNSCRHRGAPVVRDACGKAKHLVCQFHSWSYDLSGKLVGVPEARDFQGLNQAERGLDPVRCEQWNGRLFINLDPDAVPLAESYTPLMARFGDVMDWDYRVVEKQEWFTDCNWKVALDAFLETYHLKTIHSETATPYVDMRRCVNAVHVNGHSSMFTPFRDNVVGANKASDFFNTEMLAVPGLNELYSEAACSIFGFPNFFVPLDSSGFPTVTFLPLEIGKTRIDVTWWGANWGDGDRPGGWDARLETWNRIMREDMLNLEPMQESIVASTHHGFPLSYQERRIWHYNTHIDHMIGEDRIPDRMRAPNMLNHYLED
jgi:phenylpropionate dioxygenase-like ring-hydroxylating dioxygenase large terminal subunit